MARRWKIQEKLYNENIQIYYLWNNKGSERITEAAFINHHDTRMYEYENGLLY